jgi:Cellulose binding domain
MQFAPIRWLKVHQHGRLLSIITVISVVIVVGILDFTVPRAHAASYCDVTYTVSNQWQGGFGANIVIQNTGSSAWTSWSLTFAFPVSGQAVTQGWNGTFTQSGQNVTVTNLSYNGNVAANGTVNPGFNGSWTSSNPVPTSFSVNGNVCGGIDTATATSTPLNTPTSTSTVPTATPTATSTAVPGTTTAWQNGAFNVDVPNVIQQSNIVLKHPNSQSTQFMPLGNGRLGAAVWGANGFTAQLNRTDTFPDRKSLGQVVIPGLSTITSASNYSGVLNIYDATFVQSGGGMTATTYILQNKDEMVVDVTGANPSSPQTVQINLWSGRSPSATASGTFAALAETWVDNSELGASNQTFGSLAVATANGRNVTSSVVNSTSVKLSFTPNADGTFRVIIAGPQWTGGNAISTTTTLIGSDTTASTSSLQSTHLSWWHTFWNQIGKIQMHSSDGAAQYIENLRDLDLYTSAADSQGTFPGTQAGTGDLFNYAQDYVQWYPAGFWEWNLRMFAAANIGAGAFSLNTPFFNLYTSNLANIENWTKSKMGGRAGTCVPETMRFNGNGYYSYSGNDSCNQGNGAGFNAMTLTSGAEVALWIWQQYLYTGDITFLKANYPVMSTVAQFLLAYATVGSDGKLHTYPSNAHETQWSVHDPGEDTAAMQTIFPAVIRAAQLLNTDQSLVTQLQAAESKFLDFPRTDIATRSQLLTASADAGGQDILGLSADPTAAIHNTENIELAPVWPFGLIGDNSSLTALAIRTFNHRQTNVSPDWSNDPIQAARLGLASSYQSTVQTLVSNYQVFASGFSAWTGSAPTSQAQPYVETNGVIADSTQEALVQDYDGLLRIAPAWPSAWDVSGTVYVQGNSKVDVQIKGGRLITAAIEAGSTQNILTRNPWGTQNVMVVDGSTGATVVASTTASQFTIPA